ncbi:hydroxymethylbilane synthase [Eilatimonas milleporae]|uniref:Porphobilinogen deaminase n=1 Tax=Eilatimonas milleporae TaxID=911205 RepID=A0A3M0C179_9PROT|nr:hydroxymethylbilane synthase [Eilatimonas milleporae]RMB00566.1 hydroxymethylbilane synthase [Eilatimonas milleporae]
MPQADIVIGTRGSPLALAQANQVRDRLVAAHDDLEADSIRIEVIKTTGDRILDRSLMTAGGKGLFTKEIEDALLDGCIDCAVHSAKDMPTALPDGLMLAAFLVREDVRDAFISPVADCFENLPEGAVLGTASLRRRALALSRRPDLRVVTFRGNVQTRLKKLAAGEAHATFLAQAGLNRLGEAATATETLPLEDFLPAPAQGAITVECRENDTAMRARLTPLHHEKTAVCVRAERAFLSALDGSCRTPIAAHAHLQGTDLHLDGLLLSLDGRHVIRDQGNAPAEDAGPLGDGLGRSIRQTAGAGFFAQLEKDIEALLL